MTLQTSRALSVLCGLILLTSCTFTPSTPNAPSPLLNLVTVDPNASSTPTPFQPPPDSTTPRPTQTLPPSFTPLPSLTASVTPTSTQSPTATTLPTSAPGEDTPVPISNRPQYTFYVLFDYSGLQLAVDETVHYTNQTGTSLSDILLIVEANRNANSFALENLYIEGATPQYELRNNRLTVFFSKPLAPGETVNLAMRYRIAIPPKHIDHPNGYLSYQVNLTEWYPFIAPYENGWVLHDPPYYGEHLVYDAADFEVNLQLTQGGVMVAAPAPAEPNGEWTRYRLYGARTFVLSASDKFKMSESSIGSVKIQSYYFSWNADAGKGMLDAAESALALFDSLFVPYPYESLSVVATDLTDGKEYDGLFFLASEFYDSYNGTARSELVSIGVHEIAHNWWFGLVGNDQALEPWLDEAMCVYSEQLFYEFNYPGYGNWWWNYRPYHYTPSGWVDSSVYDAGGFQGYINSAYMNGAVFLDELRGRIGDEDFFAFLKDYATRYGRQRATTQDFVNVLRENTNKNVDDLIRAYFIGNY